MLSLALALVGKFRPQLIILCLGLAAFLFWSHHEYQRGVNSEKRAEAARYARAQAKAAVSTTKLAAKASETGAQSRQAQTRIITRTKTIIERVPYEIPAASDPVLGGGFLRLYNASLGLPEGSSPSPGTYKPDPGLRSSDALRSIVGNNASCSLWQDRAERLTALYEAVRREVNGG